MLIEETLNGKFSGLYGEVVADDIYKLKEVHFQPDLIIDLGACVGVFTRYARTLFPWALIVAVEPNKDNFDLLCRFTDDGNAIAINKAIGRGKMWHGRTAANGSGETYFSKSIGYSEEGMANDTSMEESNVETIMLSDIVEKYVKPKDKLLIKLDIEGQEIVLFTDEKEMEALRRADYLCAEVHFYAHTASYWRGVQEATLDALKSLESTHKCLLEGVHFWATKKGVTSSVNSSESPQNAKDFYKEVNKMYLGLDSVFNKRQIQYRRQLPKLMKALNLPMIATELGVAEANHANDLLNNGIELLYAVDVWLHIPNTTGDGNSPSSWHDGNLIQAKEKLCKHGDKVKILRGYTSEMTWMVPDNCCGLVYIDAAHDLENVRADIKNYWPKLVSGGIMAFHDFVDIPSYGVKQAVYEWAGEHDLAVYFISEDKAEDGGAYFFKP